MSPNPVALRTHLPPLSTTDVFIYLLQVQPAENDLTAIKRFPAAYSAPSENTAAGPLV